MKKLKLANLLFMFIFLGFLFVGMAVTILKPKEATSFYENRSLAVKPVLSRASLLSGQWFSGWETYLKDHAAGRESLLKASTYLDLFVMKRPVVNDIAVDTDAVKAGANGRILLSYNGYPQVDKASVAKQSAKMADSLKAFDTLVRQNGGTFLYVAVPGQTDYFAAGYPSYLDSRAASTGAARAAFKPDMAARQVSLLDMGDVFDGKGHQAGYYSVTDHHFTFDGAYETYRSIMDRLNAGGKLSLPVLTPSDFTVKTVSNPFIGSRARKIFNMIPTPEKLKIAVLNKDIPFTRTDDGGEYPSTVYSLPNNPYNVVTYTAYMGGDVGETVIKTNRPSLPNVLFVGDSFTNAVECLLYTGFNEMHALDMRSYSKKTVSAYVREYKPAVVILLRDYSVLLSFDGNGTMS